jgi:hypothetical protein
MLLVAAVGHAIWLVLAALGRAISGDAEAGSPPAREKCPGCGEPVPPTWRLCPACGLVVTGERAARLRDLAATIRQLKQFHEDGTLDADTAERLRRECKDARQQLLRESRPPQARPVGQREPALKREDEPAGHRLGRLLEECAEVGEVPATARLQALAWYREADTRELAGLSPAAQRVLARLLLREGNRHGALRAYARLLNSRPDDASLAGTALEAAESAAEANRTEMARWFLDQTLGRSPSPDLRGRAEALQRQLAVRGESLLGPCLGADWR